MLTAVGAASLDELINQTIPADIRAENPLPLPQGMTEAQYARHFNELASLNKPFKSYIGLVYNPSPTPAVIQRNIFENPSWYTSYTPYQAEISQGRLEALINFQTMVSSLTGLPIANASLLDEGTAAAKSLPLRRERRSRTPANRRKTER